MGEQELCQSRGTRLQGKGRSHSLGHKALFDKHLRVRDIEYPQSPEMWPHLLLWRPCVGQRSQAVVSDPSLGNQQIRQIRARLGDNTAAGGNHRHSSLIDRFSEPIYLRPSSCTVVRVHQSDGFL